MVTPPPSLRFGPFVLDPVNELVLRGRQRVPLTPKAFAVLRHLVTSSGRRVAKEELLEAVWPGVYVSDAALKVCISEIRKALADDARRPASSRRSIGAATPSWLPLSQLPSAAEVARGHYARASANPGAGRNWWVGRSSSRGCRPRWPEPAPESGRCSSSRANPGSARPPSPTPSSPR